MPAYINRTGQTYGALRVIGPGSTRSHWRVVCNQCGCEDEKSVVGLLQSGARNSTHCVACRRLGQIGRTRTTERQVSPWKPDPVGLLQQEWITRGFVPR